VQIKLKVTSEVEYGCAIIGNQLLSRYYWYHSLSWKRHRPYDFCSHRFFWVTQLLIFSFSLFFVSVPCAID